MIPLSKFGATGLSIVRALHVFVVLSALFFTYMEMVGRKAGFPTVGRSPFAEDWQVILGYGMLGLIFALLCGVLVCSTVLDRRCTSRALGPLQISWLVLILYEFWYDGFILTGRLTWHGYDPDGPNVRFEPVGLIIYMAFWLISAGAYAIKRSEEVQSQNQTA